MQENIREMLRSFQILCKLKTDIRYIMSYLGRADFLRFCPCLYYNVASRHIKLSLYKPLYFITEYLLFSVFLMVMRYFSLKSCFMNLSTSLHVPFELFLMLSEFVPLHKEVLNSMITVPFGLYRFHFLLLLSCLDSSIPDISLQNSLVVSVIPD